MVASNSMPGRLGGTYVLILHNPREHILEVGSLGCLVFAPGWFAYVGSAFGPGGVAARCQHHLRVSERPHWHIDYLRAASNLEQIWFSHDRQRREHQWSELLGRSRGSRQPVAGFGASDCGCNSHLFHFSSLPSFYGFRRRARRELEGHGVVSIERIT